MKKSEWSDRQLEELLRQLPKIQDHRDPRDIYQNLSIRKRRTPAWMLPGVATVAALFLFLILIPKLMDGTPYSIENANEKKSSIEEKADIAQDQSATLLSRKGSERNEEGNVKPEIQYNSSMKTAIYENEIGNGQVLTYWIPDPKGQILIPVSTIVNGKEEQSWLAMFNESMPQLTEEEWGLSDYYPLNASIELDTSDNTVVVNVPTDHKYGQGSANETNFIEALKKDVASNSNVNKIKLKTNGQTGIEFGNFGLLEEIKTQQKKDHAYFFYYPDEGEIPLLVPSMNTYTNFNEALNAMRTEQPELGLKASLVPEFQFTDASIKDRTVFVTLSENSTLIDNLSTLHSFEALLLTAKDFGMEKVMVINAPIKKIGPFDLTKEIKVPVAANFRQI